jgi:hypothetical protein
MKEFKKYTTPTTTRYVLESMTAGATGTSNIATGETTFSSIIQRQQEATTDKVKQKPRQGPMLPQTGAGRHQDKKKADKQGQAKHKKPYYEDHEISMASNELKSIYANAKKLLGLVQQYGEHGDLEAWQQSKITKAADYLYSVLQSIEGEQDKFDIDMFTENDRYNYLDYSPYARIPKNDDDYRKNDRNVGVERELNNYQIYINNKPWRIFADRRQAINIVKTLQNKGKKVEILPTALPPTPSKDMQEGLRDPNDNPCWKGYKPVGTKNKGGRTVPNCVPKEGFGEGLTNELFEPQIDYYKLTNGKIVQASYRPLPNQNATPGTVKISYVDTALKPQGASFNSSGTIKRWDAAPDGVKQEIEKFVRDQNKDVAEGSLEEVDRRGFLKGLSAAALGAAGMNSQAQINQEEDLGNGFKLVFIDVVGHTVKAVLDTTTGTYYTLNRRSDGSSAIIRNIAPYIFVKDGKIHPTMRVGPDTEAAMKKVGLNKMQEGVAEADKNFVSFMNKAMGNKVDKSVYKQDPSSIMGLHNMPGYRLALNFGLEVIKKMDQETKEHFAIADDEELLNYLQMLGEKKGLIPKKFMDEDLEEVTTLFNEVFHDPEMIGWSWADLVRDMIGAPVQAHDKERALAYLEKQRQLDMKKAKRPAPISVEKLEVVKPTLEPDHQIWYDMDDGSWKIIAGGYKNRQEAEAALDRMKKDPKATELIKNQIKIPSKPDYTPPKYESYRKGVAEEKQKGVDGKVCWKGYKRMGTKKKGGRTVDNCIKMEEDALELEEVKKGLYYYVNKRKKAGTSRPASHPDAPTPQDWKNAAKTAKKEDAYSESLMHQLNSILKEKAPPGDKYERMVKHIKKGYSKDSKITDKERSIAYATAWKAKNKAKKVDEQELKAQTQNSDRKIKPVELQPKLSTDMSFDSWEQRFQLADPNQYHQFKNKTPKKKTQMAKAAHYKARHPNK